MEGTRICTVARDGARCADVVRGGTRLSFPLWTGAIYEARRRQRDGYLTWRRVGSYGGTRSGSPDPSPAFVAELVTKAEYPWRPGIRHGHLVLDDAT